MKKRQVILAIFFMMVLSLCAGDVDKEILKDLDFYMSLDVLEDQNYDYFFEEQDKIGIQKDKSTSGEGEV